MTPVRLPPQETTALVWRPDTLGSGVGPGSPDVPPPLGTHRAWENLVVAAHDVLLHRGLRHRCGFFGPTERMFRAQGVDIELVPGGSRQFAPSHAASRPE